MRDTDPSNDQSGLAFAGFRKKRKQSEPVLTEQDNQRNNEMFDVQDGSEPPKPLKSNTKPRLESDKPNTNKEKKASAKLETGKGQKKNSAKLEAGKGQKKNSAKLEAGKGQKKAPVKGKTEKSRKKAQNRPDVDSEKLEVDESGRKVVIDVKNLYKLYKVGSTKVRALNGVDFKVYEGEFCAIVGTSGSGKSTLLNMLAGLEKPSKGEINIAGYHIEKMNENKLVRFRQRNVGFIFQSFNLLGTMNAIENVALPLSFRGMPKELRLKKAKKMLKLVGLEKHALHRPNQMSGGQQQRVGMARALVVNPKIMFADEPTGNLDSRTSKEMMSLMRRIVNEQKKTLVMVTHDDSLAAIADRVIRIVDGKIVKIEDRSTKRVEEDQNDKVER